ncbi:MAG TPA: hypothetical protein VKA00_03775 [Trueperaceae bacterium]|nr:hypothetical protein [Trueperaceae bacterium]
MKHRRPYDHSIQPDHGVAGEDATTAELGPTKPRGKRHWLPPTGGAFLMVGLLIAITILVNPLLGRYIHWRRIDMGAPVLFLGFVAALRHRWL